MKTGLFISSCNETLLQKLDIERLAARFEELAIVKTFTSFYDPSEFEELLAEVEKQELDGLVLAGESPLTYRARRNGEYLLRCLEERSLERHRIEVVNLRNMVVRPHEASADELQAKAEVLVRVGVRKVQDAPSVGQMEIAPRQSVAIVGANTASVAAASYLLDQGFKVALIQPGDELVFPPGHDALIHPTLTRTLRHERFTLHKRTRIRDFHGFAGDFTLRLERDGHIQELMVGAVVLSPSGDPQVLREMQPLFHVDIGERGTFISLDEVTARMQTQNSGVFFINPVGRGEDPATLFTAADATCASVVDLLRRRELHHAIAVSQVNETLCGGCGACVKTCLFHAVTLQGHGRVSTIDARRCRGCGNCVTACPAGARDLVTCPTGYLFDAVDILADYPAKSGDPKLLLITCDGCGYQSLDAASDQGKTWPVSVMPLWVVCGGQVDTQLIMHAFNRGFDGVTLMICGEGCCHNIIGNVDLERRLHLFQQILTSRGIPDNRLRVISTCSRESAECIESLNRFHSELTAPASGTLYYSKDDSALSVALSAPE